MDKRNSFQGTDCISRKAAENILQAFDYADFIGRPMNYHVTIHLRDDLEQCAATTFEKVRSKFNRWHKYHCRKVYGEHRKPVWAYAHEHPNEAPHVHWAVNIPEALRDDFETKVLEWVGKVQDIDKTTVEVQPIEDFRDKGVANYMIKGVDSVYVSYLHLQKIAAPQGIVHGRRSSAALSIGRTARKQAGFVAKRGVRCV